RIRMSKAMNSLERNGQPTSLRPCLKCLGYRCRFEHTDRCAMTEKQLAVGARRATLKRHALPAHSQRSAPATKVVQERSPDFVGKRQPESAARLALRDAQARCPPLYIIERERHDLARAEAIGGDEQKHGVIAESHRSRPVDSLQQCANSFPGQGARQLLAAIDARCVDLPLKSWRNLARGGQKLQEPS